MKAKNHYIVTAFIFAVILFVGRHFFQWGEMASAFVLLCFLLVAIGMRLDEIVKKIGVTNDRLDSLLRLHAESVCASRRCGKSVDVVSPAEHNSVPGEDDNAPI